MKPDSGFGNLPELAIDVTSEDGLVSSVPSKLHSWPKVLAVAQTQQPSIRTPWGDGLKYSCPVPLKTTESELGGVWEVA